MVLVGKNSIVHVAIKILTTEDDPKSENYHYQQKYGKKMDLLNLLPLVTGKIGYVFSEKSFSELKPVIEKESVKVPAKAGVIAQCDVIIEPQQTAIDPGKIVEFQRVGIQVKTNKSALEIVKEFKLCGKGDIVTETVSSMCRLLNIIPFEYALKVKKVYIGGSVIPEEYINLGPSKVIDLFQQNASLVTAVSLEAGLPNTLSVPHMIMNTFKTLLSVGLESDLKFKELEAALSNKPAEQASGPAKVEEKKGKVEAPKAPEPVEEAADVDFGDMFG
jgi:large subunit ribosomal protein LP0